MIQAKTLYIVPTPIGNLEDITLRALRVLAEVDLIAAEDTRHTAKLLHHFKITTATLALHDHNEQQRAGVLIEKLRQGKSVALVSDAGTPLISDPGYHLVRQCRMEDVRVVPLPGACAAITALSAAGLASDRFCFEGFLPAREKARDDTLQALCEEPRTLIFYESPRRLRDTVASMADLFGPQRRIVVARELSKTFESIVQMPAAELVEWLAEDANRCKGEVVLLVEGFRPEPGAIPAAAVATLRLLCQELPLKRAAALAATIHGVKKNALYKLGLDL